LLLTGAKPALLSITPGRQWPEAVVEYEPLRDAKLGTVGVVRSIELK